MSTDDRLTTAARLLRGARLSLIMSWCVILLLGALPAEVTPRPLEGLRAAVLEAFDKVGVRSGSFVFGGHRGDGKRRYWAMRAVEPHGAGQVELLHELPEGGRYKDLRWTVSVQETLSFKMFNLERISRLYEAVDPEVRDKALDQLRRSRQTASVARFFCYSELYAAHDPRERINLEVYDATVSYATGALVAHRATLMSYDCVGDRPLMDWPEPTGQPTFPGVTWSGVAGVVL